MLGSNVYPYCDHIWETVVDWNLGVQLYAKDQKLSSETFITLRVAYGLTEGADITVEGARGDASSVEVCSRYLR